MLDFNRIASAPSADISTAPAASNGRRDLPKATAWLNVGYTVEVVMSDQTTETRFVSLPVGIPLDTMEPLAINSRNQEFAQFQAARNDLRAQLVEFAGGLNPGDERILPLEIQLRRVSNPNEVPAADASNPFANKLTLA